MVVSGARFLLEFGPFSFCRKYCVVEGDLLVVVGGKRWW